MTRGFSLYLDALRIIAALAVVFGHLAHTRFTRGDFSILREINLASDAVVVFFVLSGLVIAYAAERDGSLPRFAFNRATRLFSVVFPALILTLLFDALGTRIDISAYPAPYYVETSVFEHFLRGLSLSVEWTGAFERVRLGTNGPLWSLSYEAAYYALFAFAMFLRGAIRMAAIAVAVCVFGVPILVLLPCWLLGVCVWRLIRAAPIAQPSKLAALSLAVLPVILIVLAKSLGLSEILSQMTSNALSPANHHAVLGYSDEVLWNTLLALGVAVHLLGVACLTRHNASGHDKTKMSQTIRWCAGASFSLYVVHYPTLHLLDAILPADMPLHDTFMLAATLGVTLVFARLFERPLKRFRASIMAAKRLPSIHAPKST